MSFLGEHKSGTTFLLSLIHRATKKERIKDHENPMFMLQKHKSLIFSVSTVANQGVPTVPALKLRKVESLLLRRHNHKVQNRGLVQTHLRRAVSGCPSRMVTLLTRMLLTIMIAVSRFRLLARHFITCTRRTSAAPFHELVKGLEIRALFAVNKELGRLQS
jgi:hypothetical protein